MAIVTSGGAKSCEMVEEDAGTTRGSAGEVPRAGGRPAPLHAGRTTHELEIRLLAATKS
jgi:hypothetical protein